MLTALTCCIKSHLYSVSTCPLAKEEEIIQQIFVPLQTVSPTETAPLHIYGIVPLHKQKPMDTESTMQLQFKYVNGHTWTFQAHI